mmetsp:Transcript_35253/g.100698  ORF Transcript_35253/g.100698 Transcript_35253/m.100698 type:complete len:229 (-) Transcript_35253:504-1190(-)
MFVPRFFIPSSTSIHISLCVAQRITPRPDGGVVNCMFGCSPSPRLVMQSHVLMLVLFATLPSDTSRHLSGCSAQRIGPVPEAGRRKCMFLLSPLSAHSQSSRLLLRAFPPATCRQNSGCVFQRITSAGCGLTVQRTLGNFSSRKARAAVTFTKPVSLLASPQPPLNPKELMPATTAVSLSSVPSSLAQRHQGAPLSPPQVLWLLKLPLPPQMMWSSKGHSVRFSSLES